MTRDEILNAKTIRTEPVEVPEWGGKVYVRTLSGAEMVELSAAHDAVGTNSARFASLLLCYALTDDQGGRILNPADAESLERQSAAVVNRLCVVANRLNGLGQQEADAAEKK